MCINKYIYIYIHTHIHIYTHKSANMAYAPNSCEDAVLDRRVAMVVRATL